MISANVWLLSILFAIVSSFVGAIGILYYRWRRANQRALLDQILREAEASVSPRHEEKSDRTVSLLNDKGEPWESNVDDTVNVAQRYHRGRGELQFVRTVESLQQQHKRSSAITIGVKRWTPLQRIKMAKKMGIGKGEVELAARLEHIRSKKHKKEAQG
jgi:hypothetical protein